MKYFNLMMLFVFGLCSFACAFDIPVPGPRPKRPIQEPKQPEPPAKKETIETDPKDNETKEKKDLKKFQVHLDRHATEAKLIIPKSALRELNRDIDKTSYLPPQNLIDSRPMLSQMGTVIGGMLLTLSVLFGGLWLVRHRKLSATNIGTIVFLLSLSGIGTASIVYANAGPPPQARSLTGKIFSNAVHTYKQASGELRVELTTDGDVIQLIVPDSE